MNRNNVLAALAAVVVALAVVAVAVRLVVGGGTEGSGEGTDTAQGVTTSTQPAVTLPSGSQPPVSLSEITTTTLGEGNTGEEPDLDAPLPSLTDVDLAIRPTTLDFGPVPVGEERSLEIAVFNNGDEPFDLGSITVAGVGYSVTAPRCAPAVLSRQSCTVLVTFTPQGPGVEQAVVSAANRGALAQATGDGKVPERGRLGVVVVGSGSGTVTSDPGGVSCSDDCVASFVPGATVTLTATPGPGSLFTGWSGAACGPTPTCSVTLSEPLTVLAVFDPAPPAGSLSVDLVGSGTGSGTVVSDPAGISCPPACTAEFPPGTEVTVSASAADGSTFGGWQGGGCPAAGSCTIVVGGGAQAVIAVFEEVVAADGVVTIDLVGVGRGAIGSDPAGLACDAVDAPGPRACTGTFPIGTEVTLTPVPGDGSVFAGWRGGCPAGAEPCTITVVETTDVLAEFTTG